MARFRVTLNFDVVSDDPLDAIKQAHNAMLETPAVMWDVWDVDNEQPEEARPVRIDLGAEKSIATAITEYATNPDKITGPVVARDPDVDAAALDVGGLPPKG